MIGVTNSACCSVGMDINENFNHNNLSCIDYLNGLLQSDDNGFSNAYIAIFKSCVAIVHAHMINGFDF